MKLDSTAWDKPLIGLAERKLGLYLGAFLGRERVVQAHHFGTEHVVRVVETGACIDQLVDEKRRQGGTQLTVALVALPSLNFTLETLLARRRKTDRKSTR